MAGMTVYYKLQAKEKRVPEAFLWVDKAEYIVYIIYEHMLIINRGFKLGLKRRGRPTKTRYIKAEPAVAQFSPRGRPGRPNEIELPIDQYEALRLADYKKMPHQTAGKIMGISRQTFERILKTARKNIADGIVNGKILRIEGGSVKVG